MIAPLTSMIEPEASSDRMIRCPDGFMEPIRSSLIGTAPPALMVNRARHGRYLDVLIAHSPPAGIHDGPDRAHEGFESLLWLMRTFRPRYLLHGHKHVYRNDEVTETQYGETTVVNVYPWKVIEL